MIPIQPNKNDINFSGKLVPKIKQEGETENIKEESKSKTKLREHKLGSKVKLEFRDESIKDDIGKKSSFNLRLLYKILPLPRWKTNQRKGI